MPIVGYTNRFGLSKYNYAFLAKDNYEHVPNSISVTSLGKSIMEFILTKNFPFKVDVVDMFNVKLGEAVHDAKLKTRYNKCVMRERRLYLPVDFLGLGEEIILTGAPDCIDYACNIDALGTKEKDLTVEDTKTSAIYGLAMATSKPDYAYQLSALKYLIEKGAKVKHYRDKKRFVDFKPKGKWHTHGLISGYAKDWKVRMKDQYPCPILEKPILFLPHEAIEEYIKNAFIAFKKYWDVEIQADLPPCSKEYQYQYGPVKRHKDPSQADMRPNKCVNFCFVRDICDHFQSKNRR